VLTLNCPFLLLRWRTPLPLQVLQSLVLETSVLLVGVRYSRPTARSNTHSVLCLSSPVACDCRHPSPAQLPSSLSQQFWLACGNAAHHANGKRWNVNGLLAAAAVAAACALQTPFPFPAPSIFGPCGFGFAGGSAAHHANSQFRLNVLCSLSAAASAAAVAAALQTSFPFPASSIFGLGGIGFAFVAVRRSRPTAPAVNCHMFFCCCFCSADALLLPSSFNLWPWR
jgi:hypothetical protein